MKKLNANSFLWMPALALIGVVACNKVPDNVSPDFDPETNTVKTQLILNVSTNSPSTKMPASTVQEDGNGFRGVDKVHLLTYSLDYKCAHGDYFMFKVDDPSSKATRDFDLGSMLTSADISTANSSRTLELSVPLSVNNIMVYGIAPKTGTSDAQGAVKMEGTALGSSLNTVSFSLVRRMKDETAFTGMCNLLGIALTMLTDSQLSVHKYGKADTERDNRYAFWWPIDDTSKEKPVKDASGNYFPDGTKDGKYTFYRGSISWQALGSAYEQDPNSLSPLGQVLGRAFYELVTIKSQGAGAAQISELRAGAASSLLRLMTDLSDLINRTISATPTSADEEIARLLAVEIKFRLTQFFNWPDNGSITSFLSMGTILDHANTYFKEYDTKIADYYSALTNPDNGNFFPDANGAGGFPINLDLPKGAAIMDCKRDDNNHWVFSYLTEIPAYGMGNASFPITNYRFPPELMYWANSGIYVSDKATDKLPTIPHTVADWANADKWAVSDWTPNGTISSTTRSVALMRQINYGTALLKTTVRANRATIEDNKAALFPGEENQQIQIGSTSFKVTGLFIGGIPDVVGWDFIRKNDNLPDGMTGNPYDKMIYDKLSGDVYVSTSGSDPIYTLVWDSYRPKFTSQDMSTVAGIGEQDDQASIYVALELVNQTGKDIWGELNLIRNGGTFYLVGKLDLNAADFSKVTFPDEKFFHYPPFYESGETVEVKRVFMQDYMTTARFLLTETSLQHAYMTIPDLRSSQISLGLSVDLTWQKGLDFDVVLGNN